MKVNRVFANHRFHKPVRDPFLGGPGVAGYNMLLGSESAKIRKRRSKADFCNYISSDKGRFICAKRNVEGLRR